MSADTPSPQPVAVWVMPLIAVVAWGVTAAVRSQMPAATENFFMRARVKALANDMGVKTVNVVAGKLNIEPCPKPAGDLMAGLRRAKARYVPQTKKLQVPLKYFALEEDGSMLEAVFSLLEDVKNHAEH